MGSVIGANFYTSDLQFCFDFSNPNCFAGIAGTYKELSRGVEVTATGTFGISGSGLTVAYVSGPSSLTAGTYLSLPLAYSVVPDTSAYTLEAWIKPSTMTGGGKGIFGRYSATGGGIGYGFSCETYAGVSPGRLTILHGYGGAATTTCGFYNAVDYDSWQQICLTFSNSVATFYKNGASIGTSSIRNFSYNASLVARLGASNNSFNTGYGGEIAILRLWSRALDSYQIQNLYNISKQRFGLP